MFNMQNKTQLFFFKQYASSTIPNRSLMSTENGAISIGIICLPGTKSQPAMSPSLAQEYSASNRKESISQIIPVIHQIHRTKHH